MNQDQTGSLKDVFLSITLAFLILAGTIGAVEFDKLETRINALEMRMKVVEAVR